MNDGIDGTLGEASCFLATLTSPLWLMPASPNHLLLGKRITHLT